MSTPSQKPTSYGLTTGRLEALTDGVLAVVITLLVLNFSDATDDIARLPKVTNAEILAKLASLWPHLMGYTLTFVLVAVYCLLHHMMFQHIRVATRTLVWLNVLFLLLATFLPFPTDLLAECIFHESNIVVAVYGLAHGATGLALVLLWMYAQQKQLLDAHLEESTLHAINRALWIGPAMNAAGVGLSFVSIPLAMITYAFIPIVYIVPPRMDRPWNLLGRLRRQA